MNLPYDEYSAQWTVFIVAIVRYNRKEKRGGKGERYAVRSGILCSRGG